MRELIIGLIIIVLGGYLGFILSIIFGLAFCLLSLLALLFRLTDSTTISELENWFYVKSETINTLFILFTTLTTTIYVLNHNLLNQWLGMSFFILISIGFVYFTNPKFKELCEFE